MLFKLIPQSNRVYQSIDNSSIQIVLDDYLNIISFFYYDGDSIDTSVPGFVENNAYLTFNHSAIKFDSNTNNLTCKNIGYTDLFSYYQDINDLIRSFFSEYPLLSLFYDYYDGNLYEDITFKIKSSLPDSFDLSNNFLPVSDFIILPSSEFDTNLYPELLYNYEQASMAQSFLNDTDPQKQLDPDYWSDKFLAFCKFVEEYNKNVLLLRSTRKVDASVSGSISQSGQSQTVDLTATNNALNNIANKLKRTETINNETLEKNITETINDLNLSNQTVITTVEKAPYNPLLDDGSDIDF